MGLGECTIRAFPAFGACKDKLAAVTSPPNDHAQAAAMLAPGRLNASEFASRLIGTPTERLLVLDLRSFLNFNQAHVRDAVNLSVPAPLLKRKGFSLAVAENCICKPHDKEKFRERKGIVVLLYDCNEEQSLHNTVLVSLFSALLTEGLVDVVAWLGDGFDPFEKSNPDLCKSAGPVTSKLFRNIDFKSSETKSLNSHNNSGPDEPVQILNYLFIAGEKVAGCRSALHKYNISFILNTAAECENSFPNDFTYLRLEMHDSCNQQSLVEVFDKATQFINTARDRNQNVLVHCRAGQSRSATIILAYLMKSLNWDLSRAYSYVQRRRNAVSPNLGFMGQLTQYDIQLKEQRMQQQIQANTTKPTLHILGLQRASQPRPASISPPVSIAGSLSSSVTSSASSTSSSTSSAGTSPIRSIPWYLNKVPSAPATLQSTSSLPNLKELALDATPRKLTPAPPPTTPASTTTEKPRLHLKHGLMGSAVPAAFPTIHNDQASYFAMTVEDVPQAVVSASRATSQEDGLFMSSSPSATHDSPPNKLTDSNAFIFGRTPSHACELQFHGLLQL